MPEALDFTTLDIGFQTAAQKVNFNRGFPNIKGEGAITRFAKYDAAHDDIKAGMIVVVASDGEVEKATTAAYNNQTSPPLYLAADDAKIFNYTVQQPTGMVTLLGMNYTFTTDQINPLDTLAANDHPVSGSLTLVNDVGTVLTITTGATDDTLKFQTAAGAYNFQTAGVRAGDTVTIATPTLAAIDPITIVNDTGTVLDVTTPSATTLKLDGISDFRAEGVMVGDQFILTGPGTPVQGPQKFRVDVISTDTITFDATAGINDPNGDAYTVAGGPTPDDTSFAADYEAGTVQFVHDYQGSFTIDSVGTTLDVTVIGASLLTINGLDLENDYNIGADDTFVLVAPPLSSQADQTFVVTSVSGDTITFDATGIKTPLGVAYTVAGGALPDDTSFGADYDGGTITFGQPAQTLTINVGVSTVTLTLDVDTASPALKNPNGVAYTQTTDVDFAQDFDGASAFFNRATADLVPGRAMGADAGILATLGAANEHIVGHIDSVDVLKRTVTVTPYKYRRI